MTCRKLLLVLSIPVIMQTARAQRFSLSSPDKKISVTITANGRLQYEVKYGEEQVVHPSPLGFEFRNEPPMGTDMVITGQPLRSFNDTWKPVVNSKHAVITDNYNELELDGRETGGLIRKMDLFFRVYNDGVAFRYKLYRSGRIGNREITRETTCFRLQNGGKAWVAEYGGYSSSNESEFKPHPLSYIQDKTIAGLPMLIETAGKNYMAITESAIDDYPGFYLGAGKTYAGRRDAGAALLPDEPGDDIINLTTKLVPIPGEQETGVKARFSDELYTPWRVLMLASSPGKLIESEIIQNLNAPCALTDPGWIKPGISAWDNWWSGDVKMDMPTIKRYIDMASEMGWPYMLIDWQWYGPFNKPESDITKPAPQLNMEEILQYAKNKNVRCWLWLYNSDVNRNNNFETAFAIYERWGIAGIKIDFMDRDDQDMVNWYHEIVKKAAAHHLLVDFHGAYKPDGIGRTYPNFLTREGVMGEEYSKFSNRLTPQHNVTLPFTRMLAGPMDYTPGGFLNVTKKDFKKKTPTVVMNTRCAELAKFVIYESPYTVVCDHPDHILHQPGADFLQIVHTTWDDIKVLGGYPGEYIALAKRGGDDWYIGAMTNETARRLLLHLDFLPPGSYEMESWEDAKDADQVPTHLEKSTKTIKAGDDLSINMAGSGGYVARLHLVH